MRSPTARDKARAASVEQITALLSNGPIAVRDLAKKVAVPRGTLDDHLIYMREVLRTARPTGQRIKCSMVWELGTDPTLPAADEEIDEVIAPKRGWRKAEQIGMPRDELVAALFGAPRAHQ